MPLHLTTESGPKLFKAKSLLLIATCLFIGMFLLVAIRSAVHADSINTTDFVTTWKTDNQGVSCSSCVTIPAQGGGYSYDVDWDNDGEFDEIGLTGSATHDFETPGEYTIRIRGDYPEAFGPMVDTDVKKLIEIKQWGNIKWRSMASAFQSAENLVISAIDAPDLSEVESMSSMFAGATSLNEDISHWDTRSVADMSYLFSGATNFNQDISTWDTSQVTSMRSMFANAKAFNQNISSWNTGEVTDMSSMFSGASSFNHSLGSLDVSNVSSAAFMLDGSSAFSTKNYDATLKGFASQSLKGSVRFDVEAAYCFSGPSRQHLINSFDWDIEDQGQDCGLRVGGYEILEVASGVQPGSVLGTLSANGLDLSEQKPFQITCDVPGVDDTVFEVEGDELVAAAELSYAAPRDSNRDNRYEICIKLTSEDGSVAEQSLSVVIVPASTPRPPIKINSVEFTKSQDKNILVVRGSGLFDEGDIEGPYDKSLVELNGDKLGFCALGHGKTAEAIAVEYTISPALVSNNPPCYLFLSFDGKERDFRADRVRVWLPKDFDTSKSGTVAVNGSDKYVFTGTPNTPIDTKPSKESPVTYTPVTKWLAQTGLGQAILSGGKGESESEDSVKLEVYVEGEKLGSQRKTIPSRPVFRGRATPEARVSVSVKPSGSTCEAKVDDAGDWQCELATSLNPGEYTVSVAVTRSDGSDIDYDNFEVEVLGVKTASAIENMITEAPLSPKSSRNHKIFLILAGVLVAGTVGFLLIRKTSQPAAPRRRKTRSKRPVTKKQPARRAAATKKTPARRATSNSRPTAAKKTTTATKPEAKSTSAKK